MVPATDWRTTVAESRRRSGVRVRTTLVAVLVVGAALIVAAVALVRMVQASLTADVRAIASARAGEVAADPASVDAGDAEEDFVQVVDPRGEVVAASSNLKGAPALALPAPGSDATVDEVPFEEGPFLVVAVAGSDDTVVVAGRSLDDVADARTTLIAGLAVGVPLLTCVVGVVTWLLVGRALRPVEAMREEVERISAREMDRRLPLPAGDDEIARLAVTMNRMLERLEDAQHRQRRFVADASHELRSPLASIRQHVEVAREHPERTDLSHLTEVVLEEDARLQALVDDLLLLTRLDEGVRPRREEQVDLDDLALAEAERLRTGVLEVDTSGIEAARVMGNRVQLGRVLRNLGDNADRHARTRIAISTLTRGGVTLVRVDDDGPGIAEDDRERAFERFVRLDEGRSRDAGGSGLGLPIVREIVRAHGGEVLLTEGPLGGLRAEVHLPTAG